MKKILFFLTYHGRPHMALEIQAEIILDHLVKGDYVYLVVDKSQLIFQSQSGYPENSASRYIFSKLVDKLINLITPYKDNYSILGYKFKNSPHTFESVIDSVNNIFDVKPLVYKGCNIGYGVSSSLISLHRDHGYNVKKNKDKLKREILVSETIIDTLDFYFNNINPEIIYLFNGRLAANSPIVSYCRKNNIEFRVYEFSSRKDKYHLLYNAIPHDLDYRYKELNKAWDSSEFDLEEKKIIGSRFFENQIKGVSLLEDGFLTLQDKNSDLQLQENKKIITFFNSSIDEFASVPSWEKFIYIFEDEVDAITTICNYYKEDSSKHFILRIHPNLKFLRNKQIKALEKLKLIKNLTVYAPESSIFSYQLIDKSDCVIVFGSTIGVEACYWGKPSISLGKSLYEQLDVAYYPQTKIELFELLDDNSLTPKSKENTLKYGFWWLTFGEEYTYKKNGLYNEEYFQNSKIEYFNFLFRKILSKEMFNRFISGFEGSKILKSEYRKYLKQRIKKIWS